MELNTHTALSQAEEQRRTNIVENTRRMILDALAIEVQDGTALRLPYRDFYLQIAFSPVHPLIMLQFVRTCGRQVLKRDFGRVNTLNNNSVLGGSTINEDMNCFVFRATQWLDAALEKDRFAEILARSYDEAARSYVELFS